MTAAVQTEVLAALEGVSFAYPMPDGGRREVLRDVSLTLPRGDLVALVGTNGSGKTTLLRLLTGVLKPDAGEVRLDGRALSDWRRVDVARKVAVLPQQLDLPVGFRVAELVEMGRAPHARRLFASTEADERAVARALADADALDLADRFADELSGGERQRVLVAMALAQEPELLLMDEPTLHLDLAHQVALLSAIRRLREQRNLTVVAVLHDLNLAAAFAPRVVVLDKGGISADGPAAEVLTIDLVQKVFGVVAKAAEDDDGSRYIAFSLSE